MNLWADHPQWAANRRRQRDALVDALAARGVEIRNVVGQPGQVFVRGRIMLTFMGLLETWRRLFPGAPVPPPNERYTP